MCEVCTAMDMLNTRTQTHTHTQTMEYNGIGGTMFWYAQVQTNFQPFDALTTVSTHNATNCWKTKRTTKMSDAFYSNDVL